MGACEAVTRDLRHAACVETLTIRFLPLSSFSFCSMRRLAEALDAVPNLKTLRIQTWSYHTEQLARVLRCPISERGYPFLLNSFTCMGVLHIVIGPFIQCQSAITDYSIREDLIYIYEKNKSDGVATKPTSIAPVVCPASAVLMDLRKMCVAFSAVAPLTPWK